MTTRPADDGPRPRRRPALAEALAQLGDDELLIVVDPSADRLEELAAAISRPARSRS